MFKSVRYSEKGSNDRESEERVYMYFMDYLDDCEKGYTKKISDMINLLI